jgi:hypothetical protein
MDDPSAPNPKHRKNWTPRKPRISPLDESTSSSCFDAYQCPLCIEPFSELEWRFFPCPCRYRLCSWCLHQIRTAGDSKCPQCRNIYDEQKFKVLDVTESAPFRPPPALTSTATPTAVDKKPLPGKAMRRVPVKPSRVAEIVRSVAELETRVRQVTQPKQPPKSVGVIRRPAAPTVKPGLGVWD